MATREIRKKRVQKKQQYVTDHVVIVSRSNKNISAQVFDPKTAKTLFTATSETIKSGTKIEKSQAVGKKVGEFLTKQKISKVVFNRNGLMFHGRVKELANAIRNENITM